MLFGTSRAAHCQLTAILEDRETLDLILAGPRDILTAQQQNTLVLLAKHLVSIGDEYDQDVDDQMIPEANSVNDGGPKDFADQDSIDDDGAGNDSAADDARAKKPMKKSNPWNRFLVQSLTLESNVEQHILAHGTDAMRFLNENCLAVNRTSEFSGEGGGDSLMASYRYTNQLESRQAKDNIRWCFMMLMYHDLNKIVRPEGSGRRVGPLMRQELIPFLKAAVPPEGDVPQMAKRMSKWSGYGAKLGILCKAFGPGSLFFLTRGLSPDFVKTKLTLRGRPHSVVFAHLRQLGLDKLAHESGANELGDNLRRTLIEPYKQARRKI